MAAKIFYFTATGNCLEIAQSIGGELISIPEALQEKSFNYQAEEIGFIFPCYALGVPKIVEKFLNKITLKADYVFAVMTYGEHAGGGLKHFQKICNKNKITLSYCEQIKMLDNFIPFFDIAKQIKNLPKKNIEQHKQTIVNDIAKKVCYCRKINPLTALLSLIPQTAYKLFDNGKFDKKFKVDDNCNSCGLCAKICPTQNITIESKPIFKHNCSSCLACTHRCPQNAIHVKGEKNSIRFINDSLKR
ncbi:EFR1 family ferrodoxin [Lentisphaerota bacterium WC36G]|nr:EFR1 family ferrodoxin [Lentisphaerae bacterium WC36]